MRDGNGEALRLLPWPGPEGKPAYVTADGTGGPVSRAADEVEAIQLDMAVRLLGHADRVLADSPARERELRELGRCLACSLRDVLRLAESRGGLLAAYEKQ